MKTIRTEENEEYEYKIIRNREEILKEDCESLSEIYEHLIELESKKPIGKCPGWEKKYKYYKDALERYN